MWLLISIYNLIRFSRSTLNFNPMCSCFSTGICLLLLLWQSWQLLGFIECNFQRNLSRNSNNAPMCRSMIYLQTHTPLFQLAIIIYRSWVSMHFRSARSLQRVRLQKCERVHECASSVAHNQVLGWVGGWVEHRECVRECSAAGVSDSGAAGTCTCVHRPNPVASGEREFTLSRAISVADKWMPPRTESEDARSCSLPHFWCRCSAPLI